VPPEACDDAGMVDDPHDDDIRRPPTGPTDADLLRLAGEEGARRAAEERSRERWLRQQAREETSLWSVLRVAAEHEAEVGVRTTSGRSHLAAVHGLGADFCTLLAAHGHAVYVRLDAITAVSVTRRLALPAVGDERDDPDATRLLELLGDLAHERPRVAVATVGDPERVVGDLEVVGRDVLAVRTEGAARSLVYVPAAAVTEVALL
jgi:hypothetical protein